MLNQTNPMCLEFENVFITIYAHLSLNHKGDLLRHVLDLDQREEDTLFNFFLKKLNLNLYLYSSETKDK